MPLARSWIALLMLPVAAPAPAEPGAPPAPGGLSLDRFLARQTERIMAADSDGDGRVSRAELSALARNGRDPARRFDAMDADHDGYLDRAEIQAALTRRFRRMDRDGNGVLTPDERVAGRMRPDRAAPGEAAPPQR